MEVGFMSTVNNEGKLQCVLFMKILAPECMLLSTPLGISHPSMVSKISQYFARKLRIKSTKRKCFYKYIFI